jgi:hypothetical protein
MNGMGWRVSHQERAKSAAPFGKPRAGPSRLRVNKNGCARKMKRMRLLENSSFDGLHGSDRVKLVPAVIRVVDIGTPDEIPLASHGFKIGTVVLAAGFRRVGLPYFPLAYRFED